MVWIGLGPDDQVGLPTGLVHHGQEAAPAAPGADDGGHGCRPRARRGGRIVDPLGRFKNDIGLIHPPLPENADQGKSSRPQAIG